MSAARNEHYAAFTRIT